MPAASEQRRAATISTVAVAAATLLVLLVGIWAASAGPDDPLRGQGPAPDRITTSDPRPTTEPAQVPPDDGERADVTSTGWFTKVLAAVIAVVVLLLLATAVSVLVALWPGLPRLRRRRTSTEADAVEVVDPVESVTAAIAVDAEDQERLLAAGTPRNGVVECWSRFEVQAERAGVPREPWETSSEFTLRLLALVEADLAAVERLAGLFREARFSEHELDEDDRAAALVALRRIHRDLRTALSEGRR